MQVAGTIPWFALDQEGDFIFPSTTKPFITPGAALLAVDGDAVWRIVIQSTTARGSGYNDSRFRVLGEQT